MVCALALVLAPGVAAAESYEDLAANVSVDALSGDMDSFARLMTMQRSECGFYGRNREARRVEVLVGKYQALAAAVSANDEAAAMDAGRSLYETIDRNDRFKTCWRHMVRRSDVPAGLTRVLRKI